MMFPPDGDIDTFLKCFDKQANNKLAFIIFCTGSRMEPKKQETSTYSDTGSRMEPMKQETVGYAKYRNRVKP